MSISIDSESTVEQTMLGYYRTAFPGQDLGDRSYLGLEARLFAQGISLLLRAVLDADNDAIPAYQQDADGNIRSKCSTAALDAWAFSFGLPSGVTGIYGRKSAIGSSGGAGVPVCSIGGTLIPALSQLVDTTGQVLIETTADLTTDGPPNTLTVSLRSVTTGEAANLPVGSVLTWVSPPVGVSSTMILTSALTGGQARESNTELVARLLFRLQNPPRGGTAADYRHWAEAAVDLADNNRFLNIVRAYVYPLRSGLGSVDVLITILGSGVNRDPGAVIATAALAYLNSVRPVTATVNVLRPAMLSAKALRIRVRPTPHTKYAYDWADGGNATGISAINAGAKQISCTIPVPLQAAVNAGSKPRIQVIVSTTGASPKPVQARVIAAAAGVLTLESWPFTVNPTAGTDYFYAGGPIVDVIATGILNYVDSLGPSRQSGFADPYDPWDSNVTLAHITDVVMSVRDTDGSLLVSNIDNLGSIGITIAVGAGAFAPTDYVPLDLFGSIEMAYLRSGGIEVTQA